MSRRQTPLLEFGPFRLDAEERLLFHNGTLVALAPKTFDLLLALVENRGHLLEKEELMTRLWPDSFVEEANLSRHVFTLRRVLSDGENGMTYIDTVPKRGYRFVAEVTESTGDDGWVPAKRVPSRARLINRQTKHRLLHLAG